MSDFNSLVQYTVENISRPIKYIIYKLTEFIRVVDKFVFRQVPAGAASGYATIEKIEGNTVVWNQLVNTGIYANVLPFSSAATEVSVNSDNEIEVKTIATSGVSYARGFKTAPFSSKAISVGHKYILLCESKSSVQYSYSSDSALMGVTKSLTILDYTANQWCITGTIITAVNTNNTFILRVSEQPSVGSYFYFRNFQLIDLTRIFGAGNEPTTVADFEAWMAQNIGTLPYYDYNAGELLSVKMSGMQTEDSSQQTLDTIALDVTTITGINPNTNTREVIFADGMNWLSDSIHDVIDLVNGTATKKCGIVNLGDLTWQYNSALNCFRARNVPNMIYGNTITAICVKYQTVNAVTFSTNSNDKILSIAARGIWGDGTADVAIRDTTYGNNYTSFRAAMNGVYLIYQLATPITYTDLQDANGNPLNPRYKVEQGGTEQVLPANTSTPTTVAPTLTTVYTKDVH